MPNNWGGPKDPHVGTERVNFLFFLIAATKALTGNINQELKAEETPPDVLEDENSGAGTVVPTSVGTNPILCSK